MTSLFEGLSGRSNLIVVRPTFDDRVQVSDYRILRLPPVFAKQLLDGVQMLFQTFFAWFDECGIAQGIGVRPLLSDMKTQKVKARLTTCVRTIRMGNPRLLRFE